MSHPRLHATDHSRNGGSDPIYAPWTMGAMFTHEWIGPPCVNVGTATIAEAVMRAAFMELSAEFIADRITCQVTTGGAAGSVVRLGIYAHDYSTNQPGALVLDAGTVVATSTGLKTITINKTLAPGGYWLVAVPQGAPLTDPAFEIGRPFYCTSEVDPPDLSRVAWGFERTAVSGALPDPFAMTGRAFNDLARMLLRRST